MRLFFALEFSNELKMEMKTVQKILINNSLRGNFTAPENFHLTLKYIGETKEEQVKLLQEALVNASININPFTLTIEGLGNFPRGNKSILWFGVSQNKKLNNLFKSLESQLFSIGHDKERKGYTPHITLGREVVLDQELSILDKKIQFHKEVLINKVSLMESTRINGKLTYIPIFSVELKHNTH